MVVVAAAGLTGQDFLITIEVRINTASLDNTQQPHARCSGWTNILDRCYRNVYVYVYVYVYVHVYVSNLFLTDLLSGVCSPLQL